MEDEGVDGRDLAPDGDRRLRRFARAGRARIATPAGAEIELVVAEGFAARLLGLAWLGPAGAPALLIPRCRSVHTFGMRFAIDLVFLALPAGGGDRGDGARAAEVIAVRDRLAPRRLAGVGRGRGGTRIAALELPAGAARRLAIEPSRKLSWSVLDRPPAAPARGRRGDRD